MTPRAVELVSTGAELLSGRTVNTHAQTLARALAPLGLVLVRDTTVPDDQSAIREAVREALDRVPLVFTSGRLGPTCDDLTREAVAELAGCGMVEHAPSLQAIRERYLRTGRVWNDSVGRHALVVERATVLANPVGLAPGEEVAVGGGTVYLLPGPPREFAAVLEHSVVPRLKQRGVALPLGRRVFQTCGIGESDLVTRLGPDFGAPGVEVAYCASMGRVEVRLLAEPDCTAALDALADRVRAAAGPHLYAEGDAMIEETVGRQLAERGLTLATAESCTGGLIGGRLTSVPGSSAWYAGGVVAYANEVKIRQLGVDPAVLARDGAVSEAVARQMAEGARRRFGTGLAVAVTGIAGPAGGTPEKPVGLVWMAVADAAGSVAQERRFGGDRALIREAATLLALDLVRRRLAGLVLPH